jgi:hypothetical protein
MLYMARDVQLHVLLRRVERAKLDALAASEGESRGEIVRRLIDRAHYEKFSDGVGRGVRAETSGGTPKLL